MKRIYKIIPVIVLAIPAASFALGLGQLELQSNLNEPFEARIELISVTAEELNSLSVELADTTAFQRAGIDRPYILTRLRFEVHEVEAGPEADYIRVFSSEPVREPYLNFLVEAAWSKGRLFREYTVLLDPPLYDPYARQTAIRTPDISDLDDSSARETPRTEFTPGADSGAAPAFDQPVVSAGAPGEYGPTTASDTLWSIASVYRPDASISVQQMMLALLRANPEAFQDNNINGLKRGQILRLPGRDEIMAYGQAEAFAEARAQNSAWESMNGAFAASTPARPVSPANTRTVEPDSDAAGVDTSELRLVAASEGGAGTNRGDSTGSAGNAGESGQSLALANEQLEAASQENQELRERLDEAEDLINDLRRMITLKDDELAALQERIAAGEEVSLPEELPEESPAGEDIDEALPVEDIPPEPEEFDLSLDEETGAGVEDSGADTEPAESIPEQTPAEEPADQGQPASVPPVSTAPVAAPLGMVDKAIQFVTDNLVFVAGGAGALVVLVIAFAFVSRRKSRAADAPIDTDFAAAYAPAGDATVSPEEYDSEMESEAETAMPVADIQDEAEEHDEEATVFAAASAPAAAAPVQQEPEEDPLAEVNVFLAYEHYDQAEEFVRDAIKAAPENLEFHSKLLEVFYTSGDKAKYEEEAAVLNDLVSGAGPHWEMAVAMWSEMSPSRALFEEGAGDEEDSKAETTGGGMLDLTADDSESGGSGQMDVDFDLGDLTGDSPAAEVKSDDSDVLDVTAAVSMEQVDAMESGEDLLDVTAAVGLEPEPPASGADDEEVLDITSGAEDSEDILDVSTQGGEDLLDVTAAGNIESIGEDEDLMDVTSATSAGADADELLEFISDKPDTAGAEDALDLDIGGDTGDNVIDFDSASSTPEETMKIDAPGSDTPDLDIGLDFNTGSEDAGGLDLDISDGGIDTGAETLEVDLDSLDDQVPADKDVDNGLEIDLSIGDENEDIPSLEMDSSDDDAASVELDLSDDSADAGGGLELELDGADDSSGLELDTGDDDSGIPELSLDMGDDDDDEGDHTVFVPRSNDTEEQSDADEIATKLDLAKAYVELGDKDSAKGILEEVINDGNAEQQATAKQLLKQVT